MGIIQPETTAYSGFKCTDNLRRALLPVIVKASSGPRYVVGCRTKVDKAKLKPGTRVALDMTTLTVMRALPREVSHQGIPEHVTDQPLQHHVLTVHGR